MMNLKKIVFTFMAMALCLLNMNQAFAWWNEDWTSRQDIRLDTSANGVTIEQPAQNTPLLLRLHSGNFSYFFELMEKGADLRFIAGDDKTPLKYYIERFDPINEMALIWVAVPEVKPGTNMERIFMYFGNFNAVDSSDAKGIYDVNQVLVYHFDNNAEPMDSTAYQNNPGLFEGEVKPSLIGSGAGFSGEGGMTIPGRPSLRMVPGEGWTFSTWLKSAQDQESAYVMTMGDLAVELNGTELIARYGDVKTSAANLTLSRWHHVALTLKDEAMILYLDGLPVSTVNAAIAESGSDIYIAAAADGKHGFVGDLDEISISNTARSADWIRITAENQGMDSKLLHYADVESTESSGSSSYVTVILESVTIDGWIVIFILAVMAVISWMVMIGKGLFINRVRKDNKSFIDAFRSLGAGEPDKLDTDGDKETIGEEEFNDSPLSQALFGKHDHYQSSSIYRIYHVGVQDVHKRLGQSVGAQAVGSLSSQAIDAIRASLDAAMVRESQRLNSQMVLLTIAISGGPFLGLLGTVVGVMITFAAIALEGDVNVNAIAPGIAAALVATVAGLAVAIPALFGYNYLASRIKEILADMRVFNDEFITRIAEYYDVNNR